MNQVHYNFLDAFKDALSVDGDVRDFSFADGFGGFLRARIAVLWIKDIGTLFHLHTHGFNVILREDQREFLMMERDIPDHARIYVNDFLYIDGVNYKIASSRLKDGIWTVVANILGGS